MWLTARYQPTALFSLRDSQATASGAKSLLFPSPYAIKMAILDIVLRYHGEERGKETFLWLQPIEIALHGSDQIVVNNSFIKIAKIPKNKENIVDTRGKLPFERTVAFRQYVYHHGEMVISLCVDSLTTEQIQLLRWVFPRINYFGKRGSFVQFMGFIGNLPTECIGTQPFCSNTSMFPRNTYMQVMDDMGTCLTFEKINVTDENKLSPKDRDKKIYLFPYQLKKSSKGYSLYVNSLKSGG